MAFKVSIGKFLLVLDGEIADNPEIPDGVVTVRLGGYDHVDLSGSELRLFNSSNGATYTIMVAGLNIEMVGGGSYFAPQSDVEDFPALVL